MSQHRLDVSAAIQARRTRNRHHRFYGSEHFVDVEHKTVLLEEALTYLRVRPGGGFVDCTVGAAGHSEAILEALGGSGQLLGLDRDQESLQAAQKRLGSRFSNFQLYPSDFRNLRQTLDRAGVDRVHGLLADLGVSSSQLDRPERGFSFRHEGPLDMRMDRREGPTAADLVNQLSRDELAEIFRRYGEEPAARRIARAIVRERSRSPIVSTTQLAELVRQIKGGETAARRHPATLAFQALRIRVNAELESLQEWLSQVLGCLLPGGTLVVISFHSLEDRMVKRYLREKAGKCVCFRPAEFCMCSRQKSVEILTPRPVTPSEVERIGNPRSRSAKLRAARKVEVAGEP